MSDLTDILRFTAISQLLLLIFLMLKRGGPRQYLLPGVLFCVSATSYLLTDWGWLPAILQTIFLVPAYALPFSFWLFSKSLFDDGFKLKKWMGVVLLIVLAVLFTIYFAIRYMEMPATSVQMFWLLHHSLSLAFIIPGIVEAASNRHADLVLARVKFRPAFILLTAVLMSATVLSKIAFANELPEAVEFIQKLLIAALTFFFASRQLEFKPGFSTKTEVLEAPPPKPEIDAHLINGLLDLVEGKKYFLTEGLTIRQLAARMGVKEYKLRQAINHHLGFRNFNDFLNSYRIQEACDMLTDPHRREATVLEIAFELGYNSLAPFNKAFKDITGMTPTEYRHLHR
ncbi:MAG: helix-turn-helix domain-containing protein [Saprospiraceae bacterium]